MSHGTFSKDGGTFDLHDRNLDLFSIPGVLILESSGYAIRLVNIAHSPGITRRVYFVDRVEGRVLVTEHQAKTEHEALEYLRSASRVTGHKTGGKK